MGKGDAFWTAWERRRRLRKAEEDGQVADSHEVRLGIVRRMESGEITLKQAQRELAQIKRSAKSRGLKTRNQAFLGS